MSLVSRPYYLDFLRRHKDRPIIKVVSGIRRCGKSTLFKLFQDELLADNVTAEQIIDINFELMEYDKLRDYRALYEYINKRIIPSKKMYLFLDEIQHVPSFERVVDNFFVQDNVDIYITGSNANLLSSELATYIAGRYVEIKVFPLSFKEFIKFSKIQNPQKIYTTEEYFEQYLKFGGLPAIHNFSQDKTSIYQYLTDIYNSVLLKDVISRNNIRDIELLERVILFIFDNIGNTFSAKKISDFLKSQGRKLSTETVYNYLKALENAYIISKVQRYDIKGKSILETQEKFYLLDLGLKHSQLGYKANDIAGHLENIIYLELLRRKYNVNIGKLKTKEIDFIAQKEDKKLYIQATYLLASENTIEREFSPLKNIEDNYPKYVLSMDNLGEYNINGIQRKRIIDFLLDL